MVARFRLGARHFVREFFKSRFASKNGLSGHRGQMNTHLRARVSACGVGPSFSCRFCSLPASKSFPGWFSLVKWSGGVRGIPLPHPVGVGWGDTAMLER